MNENPETSNRVPVADLAVDACSAALDLVDVGAQRSADPQKWMAVAAPMCAQCEGVEDVGEAAGRILAAEVRRLNVEADNLVLNHGRRVATLEASINHEQHECARLHQSIGEARALLDDVLCDSVDARPYPDGPNIDRELRARITAYLSGPNTKLTNLGA